MFSRLTPHRRLRDLVALAMVSCLLLDPLRAVAEMTPAAPRSQASSVQCVFEKEAINARNLQFLHILDDRRKSVGRLARTLRSATPREYSNTYQWMTSLVLRPVQWLSGGRLGPAKEGVYDAQTGLFQSEKDWIKRWSHYWPAELWNIHVHGAEFARSHPLPKAGSLDEAIQWHDDAVGAARAAQRQSKKGLRFGLTAGFLLGTAIFGSATLIPIGIAAVGGLVGIVLGQRSLHRLQNLRPAALTYGDSDRDAESSALPAGWVAVPDLIAFLTASSENARSNLAQAIKENRPLETLLDDNPGQRQYWRQLVDNFALSQARNRYQAFSELASNGIDASGHLANAEVSIELDNVHGEVRDRGRGMSLQDLLINLLIPTMTPKESKDTIGQFGVGFFSVLKLLETPEDRITVTTSNGREQHELTLRRINGTYAASIRPTSVVGEPGTAVRVDSSIDVAQATELVEERLRYVPNVRVTANGRQLNEMDGFTHIHDHDVRISFEDGPVDDAHPDRKTVLTVNGVDIPDDRIKLEATNAPRTLVVNFPTRTRLPVSRNAIEVDAVAVQSVKTAIDLAASSPDRVRLLNALAPLVDHLQKKNMSPRREDNLQEYLISQFQAWAFDSHALYLPDLPSLNSLNELIHSVKIHPLIYSRLPNLSWPFERYQEFAPKSGAQQFYVVDLQASDKIYLRYGSVILLNRAYLPKTPRAKGAYQQYLALEGIQGDFIFPARGFWILENLGLLLSQWAWSFGPGTRESLAQNTDVENMSNAMDGFLVEVKRAILTPYISLWQDRPRDIREFPRFIAVFFLIWLGNVLLFAPAQILLFSFYRLIHFAFETVWEARTFIDQGSSVAKDAFRYHRAWLAVLTASALGAVLFTVHLHGWTWLMLGIPVLSAGYNLTKTKFEISPSYKFGRFGYQLEKLADLRPPFNYLGLALLIGIEWLRSAMDAILFSIAAVLGISGKISGFVLQSIQTIFFYWRSVVFRLIWNIDPAQPAVDDFLAPILAGKTVDAGSLLFLRAVGQRLLEVDRGKAMLADPDRRLTLQTLLTKVVEEHLFKSPTEASRMTSRLIPPRSFSKYQSDLFIDFVDRALEFEPDRFILFLRVGNYFSKKAAIFLVNDRAVARYYEMWRGLLGQDRTYVDKVVTDLLTYPKTTEGAAMPYIQYMTAGLKNESTSATGINRNAPIIEMPEPDVTFRLQTLLGTYLQGWGPAVAGRVSIKNLRYMADEELEPLQAKVSERLISHSASFQSTEQFIYLRELLQNAIDEVNESKATAADRYANITTRVTRDRLIISFGDGMGMDLRRVVQSLLIPNVSTKRGKAGAIGRYGQGFFTVFRTARAIRIKTSRGDGRVVYATLTPMRREGQVVDVQIALSEREEYFKGSVIEIEEDSETAGVLEQLTEARCETYGRAVSGDVIRVSWNGKLLNRVQEKLAEVQANGSLENGTLTLYHFHPDENLLTHNGLYVKDLDPRIFQDVPKLVRDLLMDTGVVLNLPSAIILIPNRSDLADDTAQWAYLRAPLFRLCMMAAVTLASQGYLGKNLIPYDLYEDLEKYKARIPGDVFDDVRRLIANEEIDWTAYKDTNRLAMLVVLIPSVDIRGIEGKRSLMDAMRDLKANRISVWDLPPAVRALLAPQTQFERSTRLRTLLSKIGSRWMYGAEVAALAAAVIILAVYTSMHVLILAGVAVISGYMLYLSRQVLNRWLGVSFVWAEKRVVKFGRKWSRRGATLYDRSLPAKVEPGAEGAWAFIALSERAADVAEAGLENPARRQIPHTFYTEHSPSAAHAHQGSPSIGWNITALPQFLIPFCRLLRDELSDRLIYQWAKLFHEVHSHEWGHTLEKRADWTHNVTLEEKQASVLAAQIRQQETIDAIVADARRIGSSPANKRRLIQILRRPA